MQKKENLIVLLCNTGSLKNAEVLATELVKSRLIACANIIKNITSIYEWKGKIEQRSEYTLIMKTFPKNITNIEKLILELHEDEVPEIISLNTSYVFDKYLTWAEDNCG
jgi:periplasmic divalent cation tolerance protein